MFPNMTLRTLTQLLWRLSGGVLSIAAAIIVSVSLGLATQGVVASSVSLLIGLSALTGSGFSHALAFAAARQPQRARATATRAATLAVVVATVAGLLAAGFGSLALQSLPISWWSVALALPLIQLGQLGLGVAQGLALHRRYALAYLAQPVGAFVLAVIASRMTGSAASGVSPWVPALVVGPFALQAAAAVWMLARLPPSESAEPFHSLVSYTARIYPSSVAHVLSYRLDLILVGSLLGASSAGIYSLALNGVDAVARLGQSAATVLFPQFARPSSGETNVLLVRRAAEVTGMVSLAASVALAAVALTLGGTNTEVRTIGGLLLVLAVGGAGVGAWTVLGSFLAATDHLGAAARINLILLAASVTMYLTLIPAIGLYGGAIGTSAGMLLAALLGYREVTRASFSTVASRLRPEAETRFRNPSGK